MPLKDKFPNQLFYLGFITAEEILGENGLKSILNFAKLSHYIDRYPPNTLDLIYPAEDFMRFVTAIVDVVGEKGARSVMMRAGIQSFEVMLRDLPGLFALDGVEVSKGPVDKLFDEYVRIQRIITQAGVSIFGEDLYRDQLTEDGWVFDISPCYWCAGLRTEAPICYGEIGFKLGAARWIFGKDIKIEETHCIAKGDPMCRFVMYRPTE